MPASVEAAAAQLTPVWSKVCVLSSLLALIKFVAA